MNLVASRECSTSRNRSFQGVPSRLGSKLRAPCAFCASTNPSDHLSRSGFVELLGDKLKNLAFLEITACAGKLLRAAFARIPTVRTRMFLHQIAHRSPCTATEQNYRGSTGGFKPTEITAHACQMARDAFAGVALSGLAFEFSMDRRSPQGLVLRRCF